MDSVKKANEFVNKNALGLESAYRFQVKENEREFKEKKNGLKRGT